MDGLGYSAVKVEGNPTAAEQAEPPGGRWAEQRAIGTLPYLVRSDLVGKPGNFSRPNEVPTSQGPAAGPKERERAIRAVFRLSLGQRLPRVDRKSLQIFHDYLARMMAFPFQARFYDEVSPLETVEQGVVVLGLIDPRHYCPDRQTGLLCRARAAGQEIEVPLAELEVEPFTPNHQLIENYWYWVWNWQ